MAHRMLGKNVAYAVAAADAIETYGRRDPTGRHLVEECYLRLKKDAMEQIQYQSINEVVEDLAKRAGTTSIFSAVPEVQRQQRDVIQAASHSPVPFSPRIRALVDCTPVRALG